MQWQGGALEFYYTLNEVLAIYYLLKQKEGSPEHSENFQWLLPYRTKGLTRSFSATRLHLVTSPFNNPIRTAKYLQVLQFSHSLRLLLKGKCAPKVSSAVAASSANTHLLLTIQLFCYMPGKVWPIEVNETDVKIYNILYIQVNSISPSKNIKNFQKQLVFFSI